MQRTAQHASGVRYAHLGSTLADLPTIRTYIARMRIKTDMARTLLDDTIVGARSRPARRDAARAREQGGGGRSGDRGRRHGDARVRRRGVPQGRRRRALFPRRARGRRHGADDRRALRLHRQGRLRACRCSERTPNGATKPSSVGHGRRGLRPEGRDDLGRLPAVLPQLAACEFDYVLFSNYERQVEAHCAGTSTSPGTRRWRGSRPSASPQGSAGAPKRSACATPTAI